MQTLKPLFLLVTVEDFDTVQPGDFDPDLDMQDEMGVMDTICQEHLGRSFVECLYVDEATYPPGDAKGNEITACFSLVQTGHMGRKLEVPGASGDYYLVEVDSTKFIFCRWPMDSGFVLSNLDNPWA